MANVLGNLSRAALVASCALTLSGLILPGSALGQDGEVDSPPPVPSEGDPTARARALFERGLACVEQHETACAEAAFREALSLRDSPAVRYNLASALFDLRRYPEAARLTASVLADENTPAGVRAHAETLQEQLRSEAGTLEIQLEGSTPGVEVQVDGDRIPEAQRSAVLVAPGTRAITALRGDAVVAQEEVRVERGATERVTLTIAPSPEELAAAAGPVEEAPAGPALHEDWRFWTAVGGAVAVVVAIVVIAAVAASNASLEAPIEGNYMPGVLRWE